MNLSVFTKPKHLPTKEEKAKEARFTSKPYPPEVRQFTTEDDLIELVTSFAWSPFIYKEFRRESDFVKTDLLVYDIDEGQTLKEAEKIVNRLGLTCLALPTTSHTEEHHRFRLIFPLSRTIINKEEYRATYEKYAQYFTTDPACSDLGRMFFGSTLEAGFFLEGDLLVPEKVSQKRRNNSKNDYDHRDRVTVTQDLETLVERLYGEPRQKIPEGIAYFLENAPENLAGEWYKSSNSFLFSCGLAGLERETIKEVFFSLYPYEELTEKKVDKMISDGYTQREDEEI